MSYYLNGALSGVRDFASWGYNNTAGRVFGSTDQNIEQDPRVISTPPPQKQPTVSQPTETDEEQAIREKMYSVKLELIHFFQNILMKDVNARPCSVMRCNINADNFYFYSGQTNRGFEIVAPYPTVTSEEWMRIYDHICGAYYARDPKNIQNYKCNDTQNYINANMYTRVYSETKYLFRMISAIVNSRNQYGNITREQWGQFFSQVENKNPEPSIMNFIILFKNNLSLIPGERGGGKKSNRRRHKSRRMSKKNRKTKRRSH
jgi:hypothetical protein